MSVYFLGGKLIQGWLCDAFENSIERLYQINWMYTLFWKIQWYTAF